MSENIKDILATIENKRVEAIRRIMTSLDNGYLDLGMDDQEELEIIRHAMVLLIWEEE